MLLIPIDYYIYVKKYEIVGEKMLLFRYIGIEFKKMLRRREFIFVFIFAVCFSLASFLCDSNELYGSDIAGHYSAWYYWFPLHLPFGMTFGTSSSFTGLLYMFALPFMASLAYSYCYIDEYKCGVGKSIICRESRVLYFISQAIVTFIGAFLVIFIPLILNQLLWLIEIPAYTFHSVASVPYKDFPLLNIMFFKSEFLNNPYIFNLIYALIPAVVGALVGLLSFSLSLVLKKNKFFLLTIPGIIYIMVSLISAMLGHPNYAIAYVLQPTPAVGGITFTYLLVLIILPLLINVLLIAFKVLKKRDEI